MCDFEQRIDVVDIDLPEPEDLDLFRVQSKDINGGLTRAEQEVVVILIPFTPCVLDHRLTQINVRVIAAIIVEISRLFSVVSAAWTQQQTYLCSLIHGVPPIPGKKVIGHLAR